MTHHALSLPDILGADSGADASYRHISKRVTPGEPLEVPGAVLKWYWINAEDRPIPEDVTLLARGYLSTNRLQARGPGFVLLHRCGADFYFLLVSTWRNSNELWETVYYKGSDAMPDFALFPRDGDHKPNWCVWELVPVWHEQQAWVRFLKSGRDDNAVQFWLRDRFTGAA